MDSRLRGNDGKGRGSFEIGSKPGGRPHLHIKCGKVPTLSQREREITEARLDENVGAGFKPAPTRATIDPMPLLT